jgi:hypothetical protein
MTDLVTDKNEFNRILEVDNKLLMNNNPVYIDATSFRAHFFAPNKVVFGQHMNTYWANNMVLWLMSLTLIITLKFDLLRKFIEGLEKMFSSIFKK